MAYLYAWTTAGPVGTDLVSQGAEEIREGVKAALNERIQSVVANIDNDPWQFKNIATATNNTYDIGTTAARFKAGYVNALAVNIAVTPDAGSILLANSTGSIQARNFLGSGNLVMMHMSTGNVLQLYNGAVTVTAAGALGAGAGLTIAGAFAGATTGAFSGLLSANGGVTVASGQTLTLTGATVTGLTAASVGAGTFPAGAFVFNGAVSGITTLAMGGAFTGATTGLFTGLVTGALGGSFAGASTVPLYALGITPPGAVTPVHILRAGGNPNLLLAFVGTSFAAPTGVSSGNTLGGLSFGGYDGVGALRTGGTISALATETWSATATGAKIVLATRANGTITAQTVLTLDQDKSATFTGAVSGITTLAIAGALSGVTTLNMSSTLTNTSGAVVLSSTGAVSLTMNCAVGSAATTTYQLAGVTKWLVGYQVGTAGHYEIYDSVNAVTALDFTAGATPLVRFNSHVGIGAEADASYGLLVQSSAAIKIMTSSGGETGLLIANASLNVWRFTVSTLQIYGTFKVNGELLAETDATNDFGASGANRFRDGFLSRNLIIGGALTSTAGNNSNIFNAASATTGYLYGQFANTSATMVLGIEGSSAAALVPGSAAYDVVLYNQGNKGLAFGTNNLRRGGFSSAGVFDVGGTFSVTGAGSTIAPRVSSATQGSGTFAAGVAQNLFTLADGDAVLLIVTGRSGSDLIWTGWVTRNVNLYTTVATSNGGGVMTLGMSGNTLQITSSTSTVAFKFSYILFPSF